MKGIYGRRMFETWYLMTAMLHTGLDVSPVITHEFSADEYEVAFDVMRTGNCAKVILDWA
jgi:threonine 3-dehydrogenase